MARPSLARGLAKALSGSVGWHSEGEADTRKYRRCDIAGVPRAELAKTWGGIARVRSVAQPLVARRGTIQPLAGDTLNLTIPAKFYC